MNICVCGYFGLGNFGDELFLRTLQQVFAEHCVFGRKFYTDPQQVDALIIGGGDLITPYFFNNYYFPTGYEQVPTWVYGVGIVDYYPAESWPLAEVEKYRHYLQRTRAVTLRDERSAEIARSLHLHDQVTVAPDIAFAYQEPHFPVKRFAAKPNVGVCIHAYDRSALEIILKLLAKSDLAATHLVIIPVVNQVNNSYSDNAICKELADEIRAKYPHTSYTLLHPEYDLDYTYSVIQSLDLLISFKLHPSLIAIRNLVPVLCISKLSKVSSLLKSLNLSKFYCHTDEDTGKKVQLLNHLLAHGQHMIATAVPLIQHTIRTSQRGLSQLKQTIEETS